MGSRRRGSGVPFTLFAFQDIITSVTAIMLLVTLMLMVELLTKTEQSAPVVTAAVSTELEAATAAEKKEIETLSRRIAEAEVVVGLSAEELHQKTRDMERSISLAEADQARLQKLQQSTDLQIHELKKTAELKGLSEERLSAMNEQLASKQKELDKLKRSNRVIYLPTPGRNLRSWLMQLEAGAITVAEVNRKAPPTVFKGKDPFLNWISQRSPTTDSFVLLIKPDTIEMFEFYHDLLKKRGFQIGFDLLPSQASAIDSTTGAASDEP